MLSTPFFDQVIPLLEKQAAKEEAPLVINNVDLRCELRIMGHGAHYYEISSDEGDGLNIYLNNDDSADTGADEFNPEFFLEWASQLEAAAKILRRRAEEEEDHK